MLNGEVKQGGCEEKNGKAKERFKGKDVSKAFVRQESGLKEERKLEKKGSICIIIQVQMLYD